MTLCPQFNAYLDELAQQRRLSPHTVSNYRRDLNVLCELLAELPGGVAGGGRGSRTAGHGEASRIGGPAGGGFQTAAEGSGGRGGISEPPRSREEGGVERADYIGDGQKSSPT